MVGPAEVFTYANTFHGGRPAPYSLELISAAMDALIASDTGISLKAHKTLDDERRSSRPIDTLIVTSGINALDNLDMAAVDWIRTRARSIRRVSSICVGAFALAEAGLLNGRRATTHWRMAKRLQEHYPLVQVDPSPIWVRDGNVYTSAGISTGIDLALSMVGDYLGEEVALEIAKNLVLFLRRPGGQAQFSVALQSQDAPSHALSTLCHWISEHLHLDLTVEHLAERQATSVRTLIRLFQRELKTTPAKYVEDVRLEAVCRALELGHRSMEEIARHSGYHSVDVLRNAFVRRFDISPKEYARRFKTGSELAQSS